MTAKATKKSTKKATKPVSPAVAEFLAWAKKAPTIVPFETMLFREGGTFDVLVFEGPADPPGYSFSEQVALPKGLSVTVLPLVNRDGVKPGTEVNLGVYHFQLTDGRVFHTRGGDVTDAFIMPVSLNDDNAFVAVIAAGGKRFTERAATSDADDNWNPFTRLIDGWLMPQAR
jgi:hypothetical protein